MKSLKFQAYTWHHYDEDAECQIVIFGNAEDNTPISIKIADFKPWIYLELPSNIDWESGGKLQLLQSAMNRHFKYQMKTVHSMEFEMKSRLFYIQ